MSTAKLIIRASTTTKTAAFGAPMWLYEYKSDFLSGCNDLTRSERYLKHAYRRMGRPDLAKCVEGARLYQRLDHLIGGVIPDKPERFFGQLRGLAEAAWHKVGSQIPDDLEVWTKTMLARYEGWPGLDRVIKLENDLVAKRNRRPTFSKLQSWPRPERCSADTEIGFRGHHVRRGRGCWHGGAMQDQKKEMVHLGKKM